MFIITYITCGNREEAEKISEALVKENLVACVNYFSISSVYRWKDKIEKDSEFVLLCKTTEEKFSSVKERVRELHSYELPAILSIKIEDGDEGYLNWILSETDSKRD